MARAFAIQYNNRFNLKPASKFGEITYLYTDATSPPISNPQAVIEETMERLDRFSFDPKNDFIILSGAIVNVTLFVATAMLVYGEIRLLLYDPVRHHYFERQIKDPTDEQSTV